MDTINLYENRLRNKMTVAGEGGRTSAEMLKFSENRNVFVEVTAPIPNYKYTFTDASPSVDAAPNASAPPAARVWDLAGYMSLSGYALLTGGTTPTVDLELWAYDKENKNWFLVGAASGVADSEEFVFSDKVMHRIVFLRVAATSGTPTALTVNLSAG